MNWNFFHTLLQILNERAVKDTELLNSRLTKLQQDFDAQLSAAEQLAQENNQKAAELKVTVAKNVHASSKNKLLTKLLADL